MLMIDYVLLMHNILCQGSKQIVAIQSPQCVASIISTEERSCINAIFLLKRLIGLEAAAAHFMRKEIISFCFFPKSLTFCDWFMCLMINLQLRGFDFNPCYVADEQDMNTVFHIENKPFRKGPMSSRPRTNSEGHCRGGVHRGGCCFFSSLNVSNLHVLRQTRKGGVMST